MDNLLTFIVEQVCLEIPNYTQKDESQLDDDELSQTQPDKTELMDQCIQIVSFETKNKSDIQKDIVIDVIPSPVSSVQQRKNKSPTVRNQELNIKDLVVVSENFIKKSPVVNKLKDDNDCEVNPPSPTQQIKKPNHYSSFRNNLKKTMEDVKSSKINNFQNLPKSLDFCDQSKDMLQISSKPANFADALKHLNEKKSGWIYKNDINFLLQKKGLLRRSKI
ncbi:hypothetical protein TNCT_352991 [Trichonephila clavata]|uniref:Uncharacterized protein n=1 Tax=Trichonephila clavata TaxID=2740835 RepID=A0A8X6L006_TRICU|nr:hypothetical protein TNCT_352991 [Trichonephila clavata]